MVYLTIKADTRNTELYLQSLAWKIPEMEVVAMSKTLQDILTTAKPTVPKDKGILENSGYSYVEPGIDEVKGTVGFTAKSPKGYDYSYIQEYDESFQHTAGRKAHYLRDAVASQSGKFDEYFVMELQRAFR